MQLELLFCTLLTAIVFLQASSLSVNRYKIHTLSYPLEGTVKGGSEHRICWCNEYAKVTNKIMNKLQQNKTDVSCRQV
jgi:hypothetical protein